jgi:general stress protein 26
MDKTDLLTLLRNYKWAIEATVSSQGGPQAAIIGVAVTENHELVFDTLATSRKAVNLQANPHIALVIGGWSEGDARTVQYEGVADFPQGEELDRLKKIYLAAFPDGVDRLAWPGITYIRVRPRWVRLSNFNVEPPVVSELRFPQP